MGISEVDSPAAKIFPMLLTNKLSDWSVTSLFLTFCSFFCKKNLFFVFSKFQWQFSLQQNIFLLVLKLVDGGQKGKFNCTIYFWFYLYYLYWLISSFFLWTILYSNGLITKMILVSLLLFFFILSSLSFSSPLLHYYYYLL